jgi:hypothetical protein
MAKTNNPDVYLVKPSWVQRVVNGQSRTVWYLKMLTDNQVLSLTHTGTVIKHTTNEGRAVTVASVSDVAPGTKHVVDGESVEILARDAVTPARDLGPSKADVNREIHEKAHAAGMKAAEETSPTPMLVFERENPLDDSSPIVRTYEPVMSGVCGFAWINIRPGTCSFARWASKQPALKGVGTLGNKSYYGGVDISVRLFDQSMELKEAYAQAYARVLSQHGIKAFCRSRMD